MKLLFLFTNLFVFEGVCQDSLAIPYSGIKMNDFIPLHWKIVQQQQVDLNNDSLDDVVMVIGTIDSVNKNAERILLILFKTSLGYNLSSKAYNAIGCYTCGGVVGDYFDGITINSTKQSIYVNHSSKLTSPCNSTIHQFQYKNGNWYLVGKETHMWERNRECAKEDITEDFISGVTIKTKVNAICKKRILKTKTKPVSFIKLEDFNVDWVCKL